jgi:O-antigen/teichoic acid export membrane protein
MNVRKIAKNVGVTGIAQITSSILGFVILIYIARYLGETEFGKYSFALSFTSLFMVLTDVGINQYIIREISRNEKLTSEYITNITVIKLLLSFVTFGIIVATINIMNYPLETKNVVYIYGVYTILTSFVLTFKSIFQAHEKMEYTAIILISEQMLLALLVLYFLFSGHGLIKLAYSYVIVGFISLILSYCIFRLKITKPKLVINLSLWKKLIISSIPFALNALFAILFFRIDTVMLSFFKNDAAVGIYSAAYNPLLALTGIITQIIISTIYPVMAKLFVTSKDSLKILTILTSKYMIIIACPITIGCFIFANKFIDLFYVGKYYESIFVFQILALFIPIRLLSTVTGTLLSSINKQNLRMISVGFSSLLNICLNAVLIPILSYVGASIATVFSELVLYFCFIYFIKKYHYDLKVHNNVIKPLIASLIMGVIIYSTELNLIFSIVLGFLIYIIQLFLLGVFTQEDKNIGKDILNIRR